MSVPVFLLLAALAAGVIVLISRREPRWAGRQVPLLALAIVLGVSIVANLASLYAGRDAAPAWMRPLGSLWIVALGFIFLLGRGPDEPLAPRPLAWLMIGCGSLAILLSLFNLSSE